MGGHGPHRPVVGWREWIALPDLGVFAIKAKVDTGARSSALHAFDIETFERRGVWMVRFKIHPMQRDHHAVDAEARILDERYVRPSDGARQRRLAIVTTVEFLGGRWPIELTLARRDQMGFRMLLGRQALRGKFVVDPARSFLGGIPARVAPRRKKSKKKRKRGAERR